MKRAEVVASIERIARRVAEPAGIEIFEVELKGSGRHQLLRIVIDKPEGVTHADCELISREASAMLDAEDPIAGTYRLEVSSPGIERPLRNLSDWRRFTGKAAKVVLREPIEGGSKYLEGAIAAAAGDNVALSLAGGREIVFPFDRVDHASLKFDR